MDSTHGLIWKQGPLGIEGGGLRLLKWEAVSHNSSKTQKSAEVVAEGEENLEWIVGL